jgi:hypothetical protein
MLLVDSKNLAASVPYEKLSISGHGLAETLSALASQSEFASRAE